MLEEDFNELDNDFITLWSNKILTNNTSKIMPPLKQLAEQGQINAVQSYYLLKKDNEKSEVIDSIVDSYYGDSFNEELAIANKLYSESKKELNEMQEQMLHYCDLDREYREKFYETHYLEEDCDSPYEEELNRLRESYINTPYGIHFRNAISLARHSAESTQRGRYVQRYLELISSDPLLYKVDVKSIIRGAKSLRKVCTKYLKNNPDCVLTKYCLGKNYFFFSDNDKDKSKGIKILEDLAARPLIACSYQNNQKNTLI